jgi:hypothetical protein
VRQGSFGLCLFIFVNLKNQIHWVEAKQLMKQNFIGFVAETIPFIYNMTSKSERRGAFMANLFTP